MIDDFGELAATELGDVEIAIPLTGRRFVTARGANLTLPSGLVTMLSPNTTVLGGAVMATQLGSLADRVIYNSRALLA